VNFTQALYSAEEQDGMLILILEADRVSITPFSVVVIPIETGGPSKLNTVVTRTAQTDPFLNNTCTISDNYSSYTAICIVWWAITVVLSAKQCIIIGLFIMTTPI